VIGKFYKIVSAITLSSLLLLSWTVSSLWARPPSKIILEYDSDKEVLHVELRHVSTNVRDHFIRRLFIYVNDEKYKTISYVKQPHPTILKEDVELSVKEGDIVRVKAVCNETGKKEESLVIP